MRKLLSRLSVSVLFLSLILTGCGVRDAEPGPDGMDPAVDLYIPEAAITADGRLVPRTWAELAFAAGGTVAEVLVSPGDTVAQGDALVILSGSSQAEAAVAAAQLELLAARQARQALDDQLDAERAQALQAQVAARQAVRDAEAQVAYLESGAPEAEATRADALLVEAEAALEEAQDAFEDVADRDRTDLTRARLQAALAAAQLAHDEALHAYDALGEDERAERLDLARTTLEGARHQLAAAQDAHDRLADGVDPDALAATDARVQAAEAQLGAADASLAALTLRAPIDGTVVHVAAKVGELASPAVPAVVLADLLEWWIETDNLTQIDVVSIAVGQEAKVVVDALPEAMFVGEVVTLDRLYQEKRGDVTYTACLRLAGTDPRLRWGMTCAITFQGSE